MVVGNFNGWLPEVMEKYTEEEVQKQGLDHAQVDHFLKQYFIRLKVLKGFKYRFFFNVRDSMTVDKN
jgi:hypothetical protein